MVKHTQTSRRLLPTNCLSVFDHFVGLALKGLTLFSILTDSAQDGKYIGAIFLLNFYKSLNVLELTNYKLR